ncbi:MAG: hypothetical protein R6U58_08315 [Bacteroidales bacterium]
MRFIKLEKTRVNIESIRKYAPFNSSAIEFHVDDDAILLQFKSTEHRDFALWVLDDFLRKDAPFLNTEGMGVVREVRNEARSKLKEL